MKRSSKFIILLASIFITFGCLVAFCGTEHMGYYRHHQFQHYRVEKSKEKANESSPGDKHQSKEKTQNE